MTKPMLPAILSVNSFKLSDEEKRLFAKYNPLGFNFFARNIKDKKQMVELTKEIKETLERDDIIFAIDQEGGRVRRLIEPEFRPYLAQHILGDIYNEEGEEKAIEIAKYHSWLISSDLKDIGLNMNYAPVLDVAHDYTTAALKSRCFSGNEKTVATLGKVMIETYIKNGISPCIKHAPGHGKATIDPHLNLPIMNQSLKELEKDFYPFIVNNNSPALMTAHIVISEIDPKLPITQSKEAIDSLLRGKLGLDGLLISDAIDMKALKGSIGEKAKISIEAGCDAICYALGKYEELVEICENCSTMSERSLLRFEKVKNIVTLETRFQNIDKVSSEYLKKANNIELYKNDYDATEVLNKMVGK